MPGSHYKRAPIVEAIIDFKVGFDDRPSISALSKLAKSNAAGFRMPQEVRRQSIGIRGAKGGKPSVALRAQETQGFRLTSKSGERVLTVRADGFSYSHMAPYSNWEKFQEEAKEHWTKYRDSLKPKVIHRYAVRYINRFVLGESPLDTNQYFNIGAEVPRDVPHSIEKFFIQLLIPQNDIGSNVKALINIGPGESEPDGRLSIMLDFDVFATDEIDPMSESIWEKLELLRDRKNLLFEQSITDKIRELIR